jgi:hypothetical protein
MAAACRTAAAGKTESDPVKRLFQHLKGPAYIITLKDTSFYTKIQYFSRVFEEICFGETVSDSP